MVISQDFHHDTGVDAVHLSTCVNHGVKLLLTSDILIQGIFLHQLMAYVKGAMWQSD